MAETEAGGLKENQIVDENESQETELVIFKL